ncbi:hypothetical protein J8L85_02690 [Maribacter sp. MMG018]|uniref:hypothetical protein n=1 Tax=Maribacter sp. MMG018 TaxID=2822688 RepID=UPI001B36FC3C|nr:hypothetical protein [Maribacter sp. MMG018]MBQ4913330.1 hypothetical protein [Maribacter sp. MMG018]
MHKGLVKHTIGFFFLSIFLMVKMAGLHVLAHDIDQDHYAHCVVCDHVVKIQHTPEIFPLTPDYTVALIAPTPQKIITQEYKFLLDGILASDRLFSRPPPLI